MSEIKKKAELVHWETAWAERPRLSFPSGWDVRTRNVLRLLRRYLHPGMRYVAGGQGPGEIFSWVSRKIPVPVCGIDSLPIAVDTTRWLCIGQGVKADIRCEDPMTLNFEGGAFDRVRCHELFEHFEDPASKETTHVTLLAPGGTALTAVPNYRDIYLELQASCVTGNSAIHNLGIMKEPGIQALAPAAHDMTSRVFHFGSFFPPLSSLPAKLGQMGKVISWGFDFVAHLQQFNIKVLCPLRVLEERRTPEPVSGQKHGWRL